LSLLDISRWQFAITVMFHMTFPAITVGLSIFLCVLYGLHWSTGNPVYLQMFRFWRRIFAVGFAIGVVAGIVVSFEMGLNWGIYAARTGPIIGPIIGMESSPRSSWKLGSSASCSMVTAGSARPRCSSPQ
jgi:cytochrome bd ubiquinol oxidase subunit I